MKLLVFLIAFCCTTPLLAQTVQTGDGKVSITDIGQLPVSTYSGLPSCTAAKDGKMYRVTDKGGNVYRCNGATTTWLYQGLGFKAAEQSSGTDAGKINAALSAAATANALAILDGQLSSATSYPTTLTPNVTMLDLRGGFHYQYDGNVTTTIRGGITWSRKDTTDYTGSINNPTSFSLYYNPQYGGENNNTRKTNYSSLLINTLKQTPGQMNGINAIVNAPTMGDAQAIVGVTYCGGRENATGDEGCAVLRGAAYTGSVFTGTVSNISSNTITWTSGAGIDGLGQGRLLIKTNSPYSTGTITGISGTPPTVTGSGTNWASQFGTGAKSNLCFAMDTDTSTYTYKHVVPVRSITDATHLILDYTAVGIDQAWPNVGAATSGTYKIYTCSTISRVYDSSIDVADGTQFALSDSIESPLSYGGRASLIKVNGNQPIPSSLGYEGMSINNLSTLPMYTGLSLSGPYQRGLEFSGAISTYGIRFSGTLGTNIPLLSYDPATSENALIYKGINNAGSGYNSFQYSKDKDGFTVAGSLSLPYVAKTTTYSVALADYTVDCTSGSFTVTLPTAVNMAGKVYVIKNSGAGTITIATTSAQTIDGASPGTILAGKQIMVQSDGANWKRVVSNTTAVTDVAQTWSATQTMGAHLLFTDNTYDIGANGATRPRTGYFGTSVVTPALNVSGLTASTVPYLDASKNLTSSAVTPTELGYVSGVTSAIQTQLNAKAALVSPSFTTPDIGAATGTSLTLTGGNLALATAGKSVQVKTGSNACAGVATLSTGAVTQATTCVGATYGTDYMIILTPQGSSTGTIRVSAVSANTSFTITSTDAASADKVAWFIVKLN